ncbi:hypothetical protein JL39_16265 [Rhizobium sp. YS-1r]|nr:hypothetical protein JL39_16265 [Rhizobium sp. YS-1r]
MLHLRKNESFFRRSQELEGTADKARDERDKTGCETGIGGKVPRRVVRQCRGANNGAAKKDPPRPDRRIIPDLEICICDQI